MSNRSIRLYVRTKRTYGPEYFQIPLWYIDVTDFAGCTVGKIKEACRSKKDSKPKVDDLFYQNQSLADDRSVAHYNLPDGAILETTSNPIMVALIYTKMIEIERERDAHPDDIGVQRWTHKSHIKKQTLLSVLFNAKKLDDVQPPHFPTYDDFVIYLERLGRKSANINPRYSGRDFVRWFAEYLEFDTGQPDPVRSFQARHAARLGLTGPKGAGGEPAASRGDNKGKTQKGKGKQLVKRNAATAPARPRQPKQDRLCEDCEQNLAEIYCESCVGAGGSLGVLLCLECTHQVHRGALRGNHDCKDISEAPRAPRNSQGYCPHPYKAPFAIVLAMTRALSENRQKLSMDEEEIKQRAQPLTDTDLHDKQAGKIMGGFDCIENTLIPKNLIQKEASGRHTYALTQAGRELGQKLDIYDQALQRFLSDSGVPRLPARQNFSVGNQRLVLVVDEHERDLPRLHSLARTAGVKVIVRKLPVADYVWVLTPESDPGGVSYEGDHPDQEIMLPVLVERKSWNDLHDTMRFGRWDQQIRKMQACGLLLNFVLIEGCIDDLRQVTHDRKDKLQCDLERLSLDEGFHVSRTSCWSKSSAWLFWMTHLLASAHAQGRFQGETLLFSDLQSRVTRGLKEMRAGRVVRLLHPPGPCHVWEADQLVTAIFRKSLGEKKMEDTCRTVFQANEVRQLLVLRDMNTFNKNRHTLLYNCLRQASALEACTKDAVTALIEDQLMGNLKGLVHYDVFGFWQLSIQVNHQVYVMRSDTEEDTRKLTDRFSRGQQDGNTGGNNAAGVPTREHILEVPPANQQRLNAAAASVTVQPTPSTSRAADEVGAGMGVEPNASLGEETDKTLEEDDFATDSQVEERMLQEALSLSLISSLETLDNDADLSVSPASRATSIEPHQQHNESQSKSDTLHPTQSLHFTESSQSLDIIPPSISLGTSDSFGCFTRSAPLSFAAGQTSKPETVCTDRVGKKTQNNNFLPASLNSELRHCRVDQNSSLGPPSDSGEWNPACESTLACDDAASGVNTQDSLNVAGASYSPLGLGMDDAITIDSQGTDYEPDVEEVESRSALHEDERLAKRLQEEENAKSCSLSESPSQEESLSILEPVQISQEPSQTACALGSVLSPRRKRGMKTAEERSSSVVPEKKSKSHVETDEELARRLQRELNGETEEGDGHFFVPPECPSGTNSAAAYASETVQSGESRSVKQLHKGPETKGINSESVQRIPNTEHCESLPVSLENVSALPFILSTESDETLARRLAQEEKLEATRKQTHSKELVSKSHTDESCGKNNSAVIDTDVGFFVDDDEALARRLQLEEELQNGNASTSGIQPASAEMARALLEGEQSPLSTSFGMDTSYIDEDERLARQLQEEEGLERKGTFSLTSTPVSVVPTKMSTRRSETKKVVGKSAVEEDEQIARKLLLLEEGDTGVGISDHLQDDERLARMLQEQETKGSLADMKMDASVDWTTTENQGDVYQLFDGDSKLNVLSQLEEYRKSQEQKYTSQNHIKKKSPSFTWPNRKCFPSSTSTPKRSAKNSYPDGVTPGKQKHDTTFPKPASPVGDAKTGLGRLGKAEQNTSLREDKAAARFSDVKGKTDGKASEKGAALQNFWNALTGDKARSIKVGSMDAQKTSQKFGGVSGTGASPQFAGKRNIAATVTKSEVSDSVDLTDGDDFPGVGSFGKSSQSWKESSVLPPASTIKKDIDMNDSIDLTDDDVSFNTSCYSKFSAASCDGVCKKDDSAFFPTLSGPDIGERNKEEKCASELDFKRENGATGADSSGDPVSTEVASNVRCGSCGQKGHNRRFEHCPNYYSEKEMTRRQALEEAQRRRAEDRARETEERQREEQRALQRLTTTRDGLQRNKEEMMQQIALATQQCATQFQTQLDDIDRLVKSKERKVKAYDARQGRK